MSSSLTPIHNNTSASRSNKEIEQELQRQLNKYAIVIRLGVENAPNHAKWTHLRGIIEPRLKDSVNQTIRASLTKSYELGASYVTDKVGLKNATFTTHNDIDNIKILSDEFTGKFFTRARMALDLALRRDQGQQEQTNNSAISTNFITSAIAISATTKALAEGSKQKAKALIVNNRLRRPIQTAQAESEDIDFEDFVFTDTTIESLAADELEQQQWIWVTAGDACEICDDLEGETWNMDELDFMPVPVDDTHNNCRCRLLLL